MATCCRVVICKALGVGGTSMWGKKKWQRGKSKLLCEDDGDGVVEDALAKHKHVEHRVYVEGVEDGNGSYGVHSWDQWAEGKAEGR